jgi:hypothetical protein
MKNVKTLVVLFAIALSTTAFADKKADAQAKVDAAMQKSCELSKKNIDAKKDICADEATAIDAVDCADKEARKSVDFLKLGGECTKKVKAAAKAPKK